MPETKAEAAAIHPPLADFALSSHIDAPRYSEMYRFSVEDPEGF
ncbi:hypothetical protein C8N32_1221, partial [Rhodovulum imhoffii]